MEPDDDRGRQRSAEIEESDTALTSSQAETTAARAETAASRVETAASRVETQAARVETAKATDSAKIDSATVQEMIGEFTAKADEIAKASREAQDEWVAAVAAENIIFKQRNAVLVDTNRTIKRMLQVALPVLLVLLANAGYSQWRTTYRTGPTIADTKHILTDTIHDKDHRIATLEDESRKLSFVLTEQAVPAIKMLCDQITGLGGTCPQIVLDPDSAPIEAGATTDPVPADVDP